MSHNPAETYEQAKRRSLIIRRPTDVRPVRWHRNHDKRWVHLTEDEWIAICEAFDALERRLTEAGNGDRG